MNTFEQRNTYFLGHYLLDTYIRDSKARAAYGHEKARSVDQAF